MQNQAMHQNLRKPQRREKVKKSQAIAEDLLFLDLLESQQVAEVEIRIDLMRTENHLERDGFFIQLIFAGFNFRKSIHLIIFATLN
jgi:hypothetical protein